jgi:hypothetical protein
VTRNSVHAWVAAWEAGMAGRGFPRARLWIDFDDVGFTYGWTSDLDELVVAWIDRKPLSNEAPGWNAAHETFVEVDGLRPIYIIRSEALRQMMDGLN